MGADENGGRGWQYYLSSSVAATTTGEITGRGDDTLAGRGATLLLGYNAMKGTGAVLPHFTTRWRIYSAAYEDLAAVWPLAVVRLSANILVDDAFCPRRWGSWRWDSWQRCCFRLWCVRLFPVESMLLLATEWYFVRWCGSRRFGAALGGSMAPDSTRGSSGALRAWRGDTSRGGQP